MGGGMRRTMVPAARLTASEPNRGKIALTAVSDNSPLPESRRVLPQGE